MPIQDQYNAIVASATSFTAAKKNLTAQVAAYVQAFNSGASRADLAALLTACVTALNDCTTASNSLRSQVAGMSDGVAAMAISLQNLTDDQVEEMKANPQQYFCAGYLAMVNSLLFYGRETGLAIVDMVAADLKKDINDAYDDQAAGVTPDPSRTAVVFSSGHALDLVNKAIADATPAEPVPAAAP